MIYSSKIEVVYNEKNLFISAILGITYAVVEVLNSY